VRNDPFNEILIASGTLPRALFSVGHSPSPVRTMIFPRYLLLGAMVGVALMPRTASAQSATDSPAHLDVGPRRLPYREGDPIPVGYALEFRARKRPIVGGAIVFGSAYLISLALAVELPNSDPSVPWLTMPLLGPWFAFAARPSCHSGGDACDSDLTERTYLVMDGLAQATGMALIVYGTLSRTRELVRLKLHGANLELMPARVGLGYGLTAYATF
jgi:hypothetical protein